jgi:hypothetical protein
MTSRHKNLVLDAVNKGDNERSYQEMQIICKKINKYLRSLKNGKQKHGQD